MNTNVDFNEIEKFNAQAHCWWDLQGPCKPLHVINEPRLQFMRERFLDWTKLSVLDVGCGGGILTESMSKLGAKVVGIDLASPLIEVAKTHAISTNLTIDYQVADLETFAHNHSKSFDLISCMEMVEHVPSPSLVVHLCSILLKPGGFLYISTINRNIYAYIGAILGAEYLFKILPKHTHDYQRFVKPSELSQWCRNEKLEITRMKGISYNPLTHQAKLIPSVAINYILECKNS